MRRPRPVTHLGLQLRPSPLPASQCVVISPYLIPESMRDRKVVNIGDGLILRAMERLLGPVPRERLFSTREALPAPGRKLLETSRAVVSAGANQLNDHYSVLPGMTADQVSGLPCPVVLLGIGVHGLPEQASGMSFATKEVLRAVHRRVPYSSWRCPATVRYLERELPELKGRFLMTGCPVIYDRPLLDGEAFAKMSRSIAVTTTERGEFYDREVATLQFVSKRFPKAKRYLVLHQNFRPPHPAEALLHRVWPIKGRNPVLELRHAARSLGFEVFIPHTCDEAIAFYASIDLHVGSRLHAHLHFLSRAKWSFLTYVDERMTGIAEAFGFPICEPHRLADALVFNFEIVREKAIEHFAVMEHFLRSLSEIRGPQRPEHKAGFA